MLSNISRHLIALVLTTKNKETKHYMGTYSLNTKDTETLALANKTNYTLIWYTPCGLRGCKNSAHSVS